MNYLEILTSDRTWTCPKDGIYKIIAVGGGSAVSLVTKTITQLPYIINTAAGGNTSFGDLLTARGGVGETTVGKYSFSTMGVYWGGAGGYTLNEVGGTGETAIDSGLSTYINLPCTKNGSPVGYAGIGYGASGGSQASVTSVILTSHAASAPSTSSTVTYTTYTLKGNAGEVVELITDIDEGTNINCIIGQGFAWSSDKFEAYANAIGNEISEYWTSIGSSAIVEKVSFNDTQSADFLAKTTAGKNGCIVIEYIGESL